MPTKGLQKNPFSKPYEGLLDRVPGILQHEKRRGDLITIGSVSAVYCGIVRLAQHNHSPSEIAPSHNAPRRWQSLWRIANYVDERVAQLHATHTLLKVRNELRAGRARAHSNESTITDVT